MSILILGATIGSALVAGVFFTFSNFVMQALQQLPAEQGIKAMQRINATVLNPLFYLVLFGTGLSCIVVAYIGLIGGAAPLQILPPAGAAMYVLGCILVTGACNVPLNNRLASVDPAATDSSDVWKEYYSRWMRWNHVRTVSCLLAAAFIGASLLP